MKIENKNTKLEKLLEWVKHEEEEAGQKADKAYEANKELRCIGYNYAWVAFGKVKEYIEKLI